MTLYLYLAKRFFGAFLRVFAVLCLLIFVLEGLENIRGLSSQGVSFGQAGVLALLSAPALVLQ
ncbi:MAG: LptF/LptG family permease, partial [Amylibacter sp.]